MSKHDFKFSIGQKVKVVELDRPGRVLAILVDSMGACFRVRYFMNGKAEEVYFYTDELEAM